MATWLQIGVLTALGVANAVAVPVVIWLSLREPAPPPPPLTRPAPADLARAGQPLAAAGEWVTTPEGERVCRLRFAVVYGSILGTDMCDEWNPPWVQLQLGHALTPADRWARNVPGRGIQIHVEDRWIP